MRWNPGGRSKNLEDQRGASAGWRRWRRVVAVRAHRIGGLVVLLVLSVIFKKDLVSDFGGLAATRVPSAAAIRTDRRRCRIPRRSRWCSSCRGAGQRANRLERADVHGISRREARAVPRCRTTRRAVARSRQRGRSTARATRRCTSTWRSSISSIGSSARRAISRRRTCWRTRSGITCRTSWAPSVSCARRSSRIPDSQQPAVGGDGAAGGLLCRRVGVQRGPERTARARRCRRGTDGSGGGRRRSAAEDGWRSRASGGVHARLLGRTHATGSSAASRRAIRASATRSRCVKTERPERHDVPATRPACWRSWRGPQCARGAMASRDHAVGRDGGAQHALAVRHGHAAGP